MRNSIAKEIAREFRSGNKAKAKPKAPKGKPGKAKEPSGLDLKEMEEWFSATICGSAVDAISNRYGMALIAEIKRLREVTQRRKAK